MKFKFFIPLLTLVFLLSPVAYGEQNSFIVKDIKVVGLQRISIGTVFNYLPVDVGDTLQQKNVAPAIRALFKTGFFKNISLQKDGSTLLIVVKERPSIATIDIEGNEDLSTEDLTKALTAIGLSEGSVFNRQVLDKVEQELRRQYFSHGKYGLKIDTKVIDLERNRVKISINISEGAVAKIKSVNIIGSSVFPEDELLSEFELSVTSTFSFYTKNDQYSKQKLTADLERLRSYYLDRGYINFVIKSTQVSITPDKKSIYITINVEEGELFTLAKVKLSGQLIVPPEELIELLQVGPGEIFSRKSATRTSKAISDRLGEEGYAFANVNMVPDIHEESKTVDMTFFVDPASRVYVRRIHLQGNTTTRDQVLRREMRQMENAWASSARIERSKARLNRLGYFENIGIETPTVPGTRDQMDLVYSVSEKSSGNLSAGLGYSQTQGIIYNASVTQDNMFGSGKRVSLSFNKSDVSTMYSIGFTNPYFTRDGVSLGYHAMYRETDAAEANLSRYLTDVISGGFNFGFPINENQRFSLSFDVKHTTIKGANLGDHDNDVDTPDTYSPPELNKFLEDNEDSFLTLPISIGWVRDTLDKPVFSTEGSQQRISASVAIPGGDITYYKISIKDRHFFPVAKDLTWKIMGSAAYGDGYAGTDELPFFENYFGGGVNSVRGFRDNTLGPRDHYDGAAVCFDNGTPRKVTECDSRPYGGNIKILGSTELLFPIPFMSDVESVRLSVFFDVGTIQGPQYNSSGDKVGSKFSFAEFKYSAGIAAQWMSPFGALQISYGYPINADEDDETQEFQFSFGSQF